MTDGGVSASDYLAVAASTRIVQIPGEAHRTRITRGALLGMAEQVRTGFVPLTLEHLDFLPPWGRWYDADVVDRDDGEAELVLRGRDLKQFEPAGADSDPFVFQSTLPEVVPPADPNVALHIEGRNFAPDVLSEVRTQAPVPLVEESRWSVLPPLIWTLSIPVTWGAARFAGAFFDRLGGAAGDALVDWIKGVWHRSREAERDRILAVRFDLPKGGFITAFIVVPSDEQIDDPGTRAAFESIGAVATLAAQQVEQDLFPGLRRGAVIFDQDRWRLAWWTDGQGVYQSKWFRSHVPDPERFLGRPLMGVRSSDGATMDGEPSVGGRPTIESDETGEEEDGLR